MENKLYINSIDGLRAIAVMLVVLFHAGFTQFSGGFIGVDVFFVISGFLITLHIVEQNESKTFSFFNFYQRRIARLLPAAISVFLITLIASYFILSPVDLKRLGESVTYVSTSLSNIFFWTESGYFDKSSELKPFLHTWSLSVEEQYYLFWPALVVLLFSIGKRKAVIAGIAALSLISVVSAIYYYQYDPVAVFFLTPFRVYQFGIGALIALAGLHAKKKYKSYFVLVSTVALLLLAFSVNKNSHVFYASFLPAVFSGMFIIGSQSVYAEKIFASRVFVWLGQRSYSIYLVHWPLIVLWKIDTDYELSGIEKYIAVFLSILLGYILHALIEKRFRFSSKMSAETRHRIVSATYVLLLVNILIATHYWGMNGYPDRLPKDMRAYSNNMAKRWSQRISLIRQGECNLLNNKYKYEDYDQKKCLSISKDKKNWLILGDSYASGAYAIFKKAYPGVNFSQMTIPGYILVPSNMIHGNGASPRLLKLAYKFIRDTNNLDGVVIASNWFPGTVHQIEEIISEIEKSHKHVILINQRIRFKAQVPSIIGSSLSRDDAYNKANSLIIQSNYQVAKNIDAKLSGKARIVDMIDLQCSAVNKCSIFDSKGKMLYLDEAHLSLAGINYIRSKMLKRYPNLLEW